MGHTAGPKTPLPEHLLTHGGPRYAAGCWCYSMRKPRINTACTDPAYWNGVLLRAGMGVDLRRRDHQNKQKAMAARRRKKHAAQGR